jgi:hypothetical protein
MTTQILELPPVIQDILNDLNHPLHDYFVVFQSRFDCFLKTSDFNLRSQAQSVLEGMFVSATCLPSFSVELCCELKLFSDAVLDYHYILEKEKLTAQLKNEQMTELAPSLDDSVIAVHQEATISIDEDLLSPCPAQTCPTCAKPLDRALRSGSGRKALFCSDACKMRAFRQRVKRNVVTPLRNRLDSSVSQQGYVQTALLS